jgi:hypothetical protein
MAPPRIAEIPGSRSLGSRAETRKSILVAGVRGDVTDQRIIPLYDRFTRGGVGRRDFLGAPPRAA